MKPLTWALAMSLVVSIAHAEGQTADQLVASKRQADVTYRQLMEMMGAASAMIQEGIVRENQELTKTAAQMIAQHPAPKHKPWTIMAESDRAGFKQGLLAFDRILDTEATRIAEAAASRDRLAANQSAHALTNARITCDIMWKAKAKSAN